MLEPLTEELTECVCKDLDITSIQIQQNLETLKEWIQAQPQLPQCSSDTMLVTFLIASKMKMEKAKEKITNYYSARRDLSQFFTDRNPSDERLQEVGREIRLFFLPKTTPDGCRVTMMTFATGDAKNYDVPTFIKRFLMQEDIKMQLEAVNKGRYFVLDGNHFSVLHVLKLTPKICMQMIHCAQDVLPVIIKGIIFINAPTVLDIVLSLIKPFTKNKLFQRIHVHAEGPEVLDKYFPKTLLPSDYGGEAAPSNTLNEQWLKCLEENKNWLLNEGSQKAELKKQTKLKHSKTAKGLEEEVQPSFKSLSID